MSLSHGKNKYFLLTVDVLVQGQYSNLPGIACPLLAMSYVEKLHEHILTSQWRAPARGEIHEDQPRYTL
jgi:hypothetical protein